MYEVVHLRSLSKNCPLKILMPALPPTGQTKNCLALRSNENSSTPNMKLCLLRQSDDLGVRRKKVRKPGTVFTKHPMSPFMVFLPLVRFMFLPHPVLKGLPAQQDPLVAMGTGTNYITLSVRCGSFSPLALNQYWTSDGLPF